MSVVIRFGYILLFCLGSTCLSAQVPALFEGSITYAITAEGDQAKPFARMVPKTQTIWLKDLCARTQTIGGLVNQTFVYDGFAGATYLLVPDSLQAIAVPAADLRPAITREAEVLTIVGYRCQKYKISMCVGRIYNPFVVYVWMAADLRVGVGGPLAKGLYLYNDLMGFPLKIQTPVTPDGDWQWTLTATAVSRQCVNISNLMLPATYTIVAPDPNRAVVPVP